MFIALSVQHVHADEVDVVIEPNEPILGESFFVTFKMKSSGEEEPYISFTPYGASVLGKRSQGLSISTIVVNGKFSTTKEQAVVYELQAERQGQVYLRNIKVEVNGKTISVKEVRVNVLNERKKMPEAFIETEASKTKVYLGEGIDVNYYLYFKGSISANDVKEFPKLNKFIKRFHHINSPVETVQYKGQVLKRILAYSARLYPEKVGLAVLDPMKISVQIPEVEYNGFGFGTERFKNKDLASPRVEVEVLALPSEGVPKSFSGLVGEHEMSLTLDKNKFLVNEPIGVKLEVKGKGAVENFDALVVFLDNNLEQFDTKSELTELGFQAAKKVFNYTYLARSPLKISSNELEYSYFDPASSQYITKKIIVPAIIVDGMMETATNQMNTNQGDKNGVDSKNNILDSFLSKEIVKTAIPLNLVGPRFYKNTKWIDKTIVILNMVLIFAIFGLLLSFFLKSGESTGFSQADLINNEIRSIRKKGMNYSSVYRVVATLDRENKMAFGGVSIFKILDESDLTLEAKAYFKKALNALELPVYSEKVTPEGIVIHFEKKYFNEILNKK